MGVPAEAVERPDAVEAQLAAEQRQALAAALDVNRHDELARLAQLAASYWRSVALAADRGDTHTAVLHCRQLAAVTREAFALARALGTEEAES